MGKYLVEGVVRCGGEENIFSVDSQNESELQKAKPLEVTTTHEEGPLTEILKQMEIVQLQANYELTKILNKSK